MRKKDDDGIQVEYIDAHFTFRSIWHGARVLRDAGEKDDSDGFWSLMAAALLAYTAYEGFVNDMLQRLYPKDWGEEQTLFVGDYAGTLGKTRFLAERLGVELARDERPYSTVAELRAWRNDLVHSESVRIQGTARADAYARKPRRAKPVVFSKLERPSFVSRSFDDVPALAQLLLVAAKHLNHDAVRELGGTAFSGIVSSGGASLRRDSAG